MVLPTRWEGEAIGENVRSNAHEGQSQRYQFMKRATAISRTPFRNWTCENVLEWLPPRHSIPGISPTLSCTPGRHAPSHVAGVVQRCSCRSRSPKLPERVEAACQQFINTEYTKDVLSLRRNARLGRCFASAGQVDAESRVVSAVSATILARG